MEQLHAIQGGQRGEQTGMKTHGQQVPQSTFIESLATYIHKMPQSLFIVPQGSKLHTEESLKAPV